MQYYAKFRDNIAALDDLNHVKTPISGFLGVVSTTYEVEYINGTAFSVLPGGLLIDMKGIQSRAPGASTSPRLLEQPLPARRPRQLVARTRDLAGAYRIRRHLHGARHPDGAGQRREPC